MFDENVFPFSQISSPSTPPISETSLLRSDQFVDAAYTPVLLADHGAGTGRGARLELLVAESSTPPPRVDVDHVDRQLPLHGLGVPAHAADSAAGPATSSAVDAWQPAASVRQPAAASRQPAVDASPAAGRIVSASVPSGLAWLILVDCIASSC